jgi:trimethylamine:corrinoid methyltransferase-like protein
VFVEQDDKGKLPMSELTLRALSDAEVEKLHEKTLELFEKVGVYIGHQQALTLLQRAGARVDQASGRAARQNPAGATGRAR